jgi:putative heme-binding domain-containing protein
VPKGGKVRRELPNLAKADDQTLLKNLAHANAWQRETAQRLVISSPERRDALQKPVSKMLREFSTPAEAIAQAHAVALLRFETDTDVSQGKLVLNIPSAILPSQRLFLRAIEPWISKLEDGAAAPLFGPCQNEPLAFQSLLSSTALNTPPTADQIVAPATSWGDNPWTRLAIRIAARDQVSSLLNELLSREIKDHQKPLLEELAQDAGAQASESQLVSLISQVLKAPHLKTRTRWRMLTHMGEGSLRRRLDWLKLVPIEAMKDLSAEAARVYKSPDRSFDERNEALAFLALDLANDSFIRSMAEEDVNQDLRVASIRALRKSSDQAIWQPLLSRFPRETPAVRRAMLDQVLGDAKRAAVLLDEIEAGRIKAAEMDPAQMNRLKQLGNADFKARVGKLLAAATPADRAQALADYQKALDLPNEPKRGQAIFQKNCATCHKIGEIGVNVAPDISDSRTKTPAQILADVIQPNRAIDANYLAYNVRLEDGETLTGILAAETATSITLRQPGDKTLTLSRSEIADLKSSGLSLMPDGLERQIPQQDMADLISFIKNWRYLDGKTPLGK